MLLSSHNIFRVNIHIPDEAFLHIPDEAFHEKYIFFQGLYSLNGKTSYHQISCEVSKRRDWMP